MSKVFKRTTAAVAGMIASVMFVTTALAQMPASPWKKGAPFPEPDEELYGVTANGKLYVVGGWDDGKAGGVTYEYNPATDKWTKKQSMPRPAHHAALAAANGKIYVMGGFVPPSDTALPLGAAWQPIDNAWEYDPAADSWRALAPMPMKRCSAVAAEVSGKIYVIGGATLMENSGETALFGNRPQRVVGTNQVYDPATNTWATRSPMPTTRNHAFAGAVNGKIYVIGGRLGAAHVTASSNTDVVEEYDPARDTWGAIKARMPTPRSGGGWATLNGRIYVAGGEIQNERYHATFKALEAYEPATNRWIILPSMPSARHGVAGAFIGNRLHLVSGKPEGGGLPDLAPKATAVHDVLEIPAGLGTN